MKFKTFPLTVTEEWLDQLDEVKHEHESKHEFIVKAVNEQVKFRKTGNSVIYEDKKGSE